MKLDVKTLKNRCKKAKDAVDINSSLFEQLDDFGNPFKDTWYNDTKQHVANNTAYDSTAMNCVNNFINTMTSSFTPVFSEWASLKAGPMIEENIKDAVQRDLDKITERLFSYLNVSNFNSASAEMYYELCKSTGVMLVIENDSQSQPFTFIPVPLSKCGFLQGKHGMIDFMTRKSKMYYRLVKETWKKAKISSTLNNTINDKPDDEVEIYEAFYYDYKELNWVYAVLIEDEIIFESTSNESPMIVARWSTVPNAVTGIGPLMMSLPDIKQLNEIKKMTLKSAALNVFGAYTVTDDNVINPASLQIVPGGFIPVSKNGGPEGPSIQPLPTVGSFQAQEFMLTDLKDSIKKTLLNVNLPDESSSIRTAFEISQRLQEGQRNIGSSYGKLVKEFAIPLVKRCVEILANKKLIDLPQGFEIDGLFVNCEITSPLANEQNTEKLNKSIQAYSMLAQINPELAETSVNLEKLPSYVFDKLGASRELLRTPEEIENVQESNNQQKTSQFQQEMLLKNPDAMANVLQMGQQPL